MSVGGETDDRVAEFEALLRTHDSAVRSLAHRLIGGDVDDVLQDAYVKAFRSWTGFREESSFRTWLHRIVYTTALNHRRSDDRREAATVASVVPGPGSDRDIASTVSSTMDLASALGELPADQRTVVVLVDRDGWSYDDVGTVVGIPAGTVASRLHRARATLRTILGEGGMR